MSNIINAQQAVLIDNIDFETTMKIAEEELRRNIATEELKIWAIRDRVISPAAAAKISSLSLDNIDGLYHTKRLT
ncbi:hypothetical protein [Paraglaciecola chathamensis]|uniref:Uncharacterized protein n=1 Tax=Paraglaciecola chathamensis S18K6 TaxID=1127672 RepID=A0AAV3V7Z7_9ALTE|nr:hypothetical protein [Paraglaciecola chathamensis]GAC12580.1 hypothetical protein GCHA_4663 [Paraglaciecola chathamensis S18K6]